MKKVAVITLPLTNYNYGGILQAYALQQYLSNVFEVDVQHLDRRYNETALLKLKIGIFNIWQKRTKLAQKYHVQPLSDFITENIKLSIPLKSPTALVRYLEAQKTELLITGSDQVWNYNYAYNISDDLLLKSHYSCTKISYAASFGANNYAIPQAAREIYKLDGISVRESSACRLLNEQGVPAKQHLDPTLLIEASHYQQLALRSAKTYNGSLVGYFLDNTSFTVEVCRALEEITGKEVEIIGKRAKNITVESQVPPMDSIEDWLKGFAEADYIVTDSFHGCVFSILFKKQFITLGNSQRGIERFHSLLHLFGLEDQIITTSQDVQKIFKDIDYCSVDARLSDLRIEAAKYLGKFIVSDNA